MHNPWVSPFSYLAISSPPPLTAAVMVHTTELLFRSHLSPLLLLAHLPYALFAHLLSHSLILIHLPPSLCQLPSAPNFDCFDASQGPGVCSFGIAVFMPCYSNDFEGFQPSLSYVYRAPQSGSLPGISTERKSVLSAFCEKHSSPQVPWGQLARGFWPGAMELSSLPGRFGGVVVLSSGRHLRFVFFGVSPGCHQVVVAGGKHIPLRAGRATILRAMSGSVPKRFAMPRCPTPAPINAISRCLARPGPRTLTMHIMSISAETGRSLAKKQSYCTPTAHETGRLSLASQQSTRAKGGLPIQQRGGVRSTV
jgi:hypothetical protein